MKIGTLLGYSKRPKAPLQTITGRVREGVVSIHSTESATSSSIAPGFVNSLIKIADTINSGDDSFAVGITDDGNYFCEVVKELGYAQYCLVSYNKKIKWFDVAAMQVLDGGRFSSSSSPITLGPESTDSTRNGTVLIGALLPILSSCTEFSSAFDSLIADSASGYPIRAETANTAALLSENVYRRLTNKEFDLSLLNDSLETIELNSALSLDDITIKETIYGSFSTESDITLPEAPKSVTMNPSEFIGAYKFSDREFTEEEAKLLEVNKLDDFYVLESRDHEICNIIKETSVLNQPFRVFTFRGDAGTGKSAKAKAVAAGLNLPLVTYTCSANTEIFDFIGQVMPDTSSDSGNNELRQRVEAIGELTMNNTAKALGLHTIEDVAMDPALFLESQGISAQDCDALDMDLSIKAIEAWNDMIAPHFKAALSSGDGTPNYIYTETDFIKAIKHGWVVEVQEPNVIMSEGTLVGLNGLLAEGKITLPTGEVVTRHPDTVIIFTTNVSYNGCRNMNQSVIDRSNKVYDIDAPSLNMMVDRAMSLSGNTDKKQVTEMAQAINTIAEEMKQQGIEDGVCGMRSLSNWATAARFENVKDAFVSCVLSKTSFDETCRNDLLSVIDCFSFK